MLEDPRLAHCTLCPVCFKGLCTFMRLNRRAIGPTGASPALCPHGEDLVLLNVRLWPYGAGRGRASEQMTMQRKGCSLSLGTTFRPPGDISKTKGSTPFVAPELHSTCPSLKFVSLLCSCLSAHIRICIEFEISFLSTVGLIRNWPHRRT